MPSLGGECHHCWLVCRSLAGDSYGQADNKFAAARTLSRMTEMNGLEYITGQRDRWAAMASSGIHTMGGGGESSELTAAGHDRP